MAGSPIPFANAFKALTGHAPFPWQERIYDDWLARGETPPSCNLPTGLGKTSVVAIWLIALANGAKVPRRLVYVVNRRTVVDQTTAEVERIRDRIETAGIAAALRRVCRLDDHEPPLAISTLRGQFADNREWSADPARPAIIVGTVDMIGSRLLFSGYDVGFKSRPLHAGFLGQDTLLVHDEAHLEPAFQRLIETIQREQARCCDFRPLRVMELTATSRASSGAFTLDQDDHRDATVKRRINAKKSLRLHAQTDPKGLADRIADLATQHKDSGVAVLIFARTVDDVIKIREKLARAKLQVEMLTGTLRGKERDELVNRPIFQRFLSAANRSSNVELPNETVYLVCTSAGEVGVNISGDHMVCDLTTFESMAQRFGRVNRFGDRTDTRIDVVYPETFDEKDKLTPARQVTLKLLGQLRGDASPQALSRLDAQQRQAAFAPEPTILPATDILFDAWALTTIRDKMPGRPPVEPYLHGLAEWEPPRTSVAWRQEVASITNELIERHGDRFLQALLEDYPLKPHELLNDTSERVYRCLEAIGKRADGSCALWIVGERGEIEVSSFGELLRAEKKRAVGRIRECTVLLPPAAGGLNEGMLDGTSEHADDVADLPEHPSERRIRKVRMESAETQEGGATDGMRLVRSIELDPDEPDENARKVWEWYKLRPLEDTRSAQRPVALATHIDDAERNARRIAGGLSLPRDMSDALVLAVKLHDCGKGREPFQIALGNRGYPDLLWAKSGRRGVWLPEPFRHEFASLLDAADDAEVQELPPAMRDLVLHLIGAHHGRARPHVPADEAFDPQRPTTAVEAAAVEIPRRFARLQRQYGRWGLAYLESLLRAADWAASAEPSHFLDRNEEVSS
jgi:CRISPR-associated endonuclease/helicase Cas3